jgi:hypothetical protein
VVDKVVAPTATEQGYTVYKCGICGATKNDNYVPATGGGSSQGSGGGGSGAYIAPTPKPTPKPADADTKKDPSDAIEIVDRGTPYAPFDFPANQFVDVFADDWFVNDVAFIYYIGLMKGTSTDPLKFSPYLDTTRGMIVTILYRLAGSPEVAGESQFTDVNEGDYYYDAVLWAAPKGIILGYGDGTYGPDDVITREQLAAIIYRYQQYSGLIPSTTKGKMQFSDIGMFEEYSKKPVEELAMQGLINGKPNNLYDPKGLAIRAEVAAVFRRYIEAAIEDGYELEIMQKVYSYR